MSWSRRRDSHVEPLPGWALPVIHLVSFSYPPVNTPAAHRPHQVALALEAAGEPFTLYTARGIQGGSAPFPVTSIASTIRPPRRTTLVALFNLARRALLPLLEIDFMLPWALRTFPRLWWNLVRERAETGRRPTVWATSPGISNANLALLAGLLSGARVHLDYRDMSVGVERGRLPFLTWLCLRSAASLTTVTPLLTGQFQKAAGGRRVDLVYNGTSAEALRAGDSAESRDRADLCVAYVGALYGGSRPVEEAVLALAGAARHLPAGGFGALRLLLVAREEGLDQLRIHEHERFRIEIRASVPREEALAIAAGAHLNMLLIAAEHRCSIPLKAFDLLGVGRPIFYVGPADAEAATLLKGLHEVSWSEVNPGLAAPGPGQLAALIAAQAALPSRPCGRISAAEEATKIVALLRG